MNCRAKYGLMGVFFGWLITNGRLLYLFVENIIVDMMGKNDAGGLSIYLSSLV